MATTKSGDAAQDKRRRAAAYKFLDSIKLAYGCYRCGYKGSVYALEFDHIDPARKIRDVSACQSWRQLESELELCDVICKNCHVEKSVDEGTYWCTRSSDVPETKNGHPGPQPTQKLLDIRRDWLSRRKIF